MTTLIIATRNTHKVGEISAILGPEFRCLTLRDFPDAPPVVEDADTFAGNAAKKANELAAWLRARAASDGFPPDALVLADDSGLEVDALHGAPGVHSARFAALDSGAPGNSKDADNNAKLLRLLAGVPEDRRTGRFRCVIALAPVAGGAPEVFDGACEGVISRVPSGGGGFGYDPLFVPDGHTQSFAELGEDIKNGLSHRARALEKMRGWFAARR
jgi:XTP/dITP diphosphohydrolase